jgi:hypothetical protein
MTTSNPTTYSNKCEILGNLWLEYRDEEEFKDFIEYTDLGLPLAYAIASGIVETSLRAQGFIEEAWNLFLAGLGIEEDTGFETLDDVLSIG